MKSKFILLLGARAPIALELARSFHKQGCNVVLADSLKFPIGRWSNSVIKYVRLPNARQNTLEYIEAISSLVSKYSISHLLPTCEETFYIAQHKNNWSCKVWTSDIKLMDSLHNKETFEQEFRNKLPIPETISLDAFSNWSQSDKYVFKPKYSRFGSNVFINQPLTMDSFSGTKNWIAQKKVEGKEICIYSIWDAGNLKGYASYEPIFKAGKGSAIFFRPVENQKAKNQVENFGKTLNYTGQLSFDVIISDDTPWFIECNPRGTSGAHLLNNSLAECFIDVNEKATVEMGDFMLASLMLSTRPLKFFLKRIRKANDVIFRLNDPLPALAQMLSLLELVFIKLSKGISLLEATTYDIEWNGYEY
ncbi:ATP-grasp domain-containing protein [Aestuariivivens sediminis]|uniref:ATP-grasp domain-containing protein n=1 Tax=Aestuariivivens sediminis TaxID=2913557 RepID=UPI001F591759|nr:ATP-grasp domain-containing protein [Aestuariivivens sediminis]